MKTLRLKVKAESYAWLEQAAREVNFVWNWANETSERGIRRYAGPSKFLSAFDLHKLAAGGSENFARIGADVINSVCTEYAKKRRQERLARLSWRRSGGSKRSLGWVPFRADNLKRKGRALRFCGKTIRVFEYERLEGVKFHDACFAQDALGQWWLCMPVETAVEQAVAPYELVGIDLGLKAAATTSDGGVLDSGRPYRTLEPKIAQAQRRGHKRQAKRLHLKAKNQRADSLHKFTTWIVGTYQNIRIGDVSSSKLAKTKMAKSVLDAGWYMLKTQLQYKGQQAGRSVEIVDEAYTTRACSNCGQLTGPRGLGQLVVRQWTCECGATHDRDVNAAKNIARLRSGPPSAGTRCSI